MAATVLVEPKITGGQRLLAALDQTPVRPFAAFWLWDAEAEEWQLIIGTDMVDEAGPTAALAMIQQVLREQFATDSIQLREVVVVGQRDRRLGLLREVPLTGRAIPTAPLHIERAVVGGQLVDDAYIYRNVGPGRITELRATGISEHNFTVEVKANASMEARLSLFRDGALVEGPISLQVMGPPRVGILRPTAKTFQGLESGVTYRVVADTDDDHREVKVTTRRRS